ncbi:MAG: insulinase family protein [Treponema sp.]|nr:insulinase family protein [Treponema sp.]
MHKFYTLLLFLLLSVQLFASTPQRVEEYTLENGLQVFLLEDSQDARVHIEYTCRAGFSSQTKTTCGFFKLFTRLVKAASPSLNYTDIQCNADSSRYFIDVSPSQLQDTLISLSDAVFSPDFSDELLKPELNALKKEVSDNASSMGTVINAAIDSRVFSAAPWKHDSGIYPPLFKKTTEKTARTILKEISDLWYTPQNSAIFISGNINAERTMLILKNSFGRFYSNFRPPVEKPSAPVNQQRKYVLHSPEISAELTQLVVQYTMLDMEQSDLMSISLGYEGSLFKQLILSQTDLNIPGDEYINVSAAHKKDSSRLIIQTLMQPPENKKKGLTSIQQTELFLQQLKEIKNTVRPEEFEYARNQTDYSMARTSAVPQSLMETLSSFWALEPYISHSETDSENYLSETTAFMMGRSEKLKGQTLAECLNILDAENPFVFVIINSKDYKANKKAYEKAGFEEITDKNASWYLQAMFREIREAENADTDKSLYIVNKNIYDNSYYLKNKDNFDFFTLSNSIPVITKANPLSSRVSFVLSIKGGKYSSADDNGFEEVMINLLAGLIQKKLFNAQEEGLITGAPYVSSKTDLSTGLVIIEFDSEDTIAAIRLIADAIVYGEIAPADADRAVSSRKYRKRLENGTVANQLYETLLANAYEKAAWQEIFDTEKEILLDTDYTKILSAYPALLDASRYTMIFCGDVFEKDNLQPLLEESFGLLANNDLEEKTVEKHELKNLTASKRDISSKVRHTFLTDIPAEKAGPQPAILIPTTEFLDPVIYAFTAPKAGSKQAALYNAVLNWLGTEISRKNSVKVNIQFPRNGIDLGSLTVMNVAHTRELDAQYKTLIQSLNDGLNSIQTNEKLLRFIKASWIHNQMAETNSDTGTALLIQKGLELFGSPQAASFFLEEYNWILQAESNDFVEIMEYFPIRPPLRVYSADSKK